MTTRRAARQTSGEATPSSQQPATTVNTNTNSNEDDEIMHGLEAASLKHAAAMSEKVAKENGVKPADKHLANNATPTAPKSSPTKIILKNTSSSINGFTQPKDAATTFSSSPDGNSKNSVSPKVAVLSNSAGVIKIKVPHKMPTPPGIDEKDQEIKSSKPSTPTPFSLAREVPQFIKPVSPSDTAVKGEDVAKTPKQQEKLPDAVSSPPTSQSITPSNSSTKGSGGKRKREQQDQPAVTEPPKKRGRKPKINTTTEVSEPNIQQNGPATLKQVEQVVDEDTVAQLSPDPTGRRKKLAKKLVGNVDLEHDLENTASPKKVTTMEQQIAQAIIKGMSSKSLSGPRETRQKTAQPPTDVSEPKLMPRERKMTAKKLASPDPPSVPVVEPAPVPVSVREQTPKPSAKARGKRKAEETPAESTEPPKKRGRPARKTATPATARNVEALEKVAGPSSQAIDPARTTKSTNKTTETPTNTRPKRQRRAAKAPEAQEAQSPPSIVIDPPQTPAPVLPRTLSPDPYDLAPRSYNGIFSPSQRYANSWEESSFAGRINPNDLNSATFGSFTSPVPFDSSPFPRPQDLSWNGDPSAESTINQPCKCDLCKRTMDNIASLRAGRRYFFSYDSSIYPTEATEATGAVPVAFGKLADHRFLICGNPKPNTPLPENNAAWASGLPTIAPSPGDEVFGLLYECPDSECLAKMMTLAGRSTHDFHRDKVHVELLVHEHRRHPELAGLQAAKPLRVVAHVDAVAVRADRSRYYMPEQPKTDAPAPPPKEEEEEEEEETGRGRRSGRGRSKQKSKTPPVKPKPKAKGRGKGKGKGKAEPEPEPEPQEEEPKPQPDSSTFQGEVAPLMEGYAEDMNGAIADATLTGGAFPYSYVKEVVRKWVPMQQARFAMSYTPPETKH